MDDFPSLKARRLLAILTREPLSYRVVRQTGSHRVLVAPGRPRVLFAFHDRQTVRSHVVKRVLCHDVGLEPDAARELL